MAKLMKLMIFLSINVLLQYSNCKRQKRGITDFLIPGINVGDIALDALKNYIYGAPVDKDQMILDRQLEHMETSREILSLTQDIAVAAENAPEMTILIQSFQKFPNFINNIDDAFRQYEVLEHSKKNGSDYLVHQFAEHSNNRYIGPLKEIINLYSLTIPANSNRRTSKGDYSLLSLMSRQMKDFKKVCDKLKSQQQMLQIMLDAVTICEFKTFLIMEFSLRKLAETEQIDYQMELKTLSDNLQNRFERLTRTFQSFVKDASREVWRCDNSDIPHTEGETYFKLRLFQSYIARDRDLRGATTCYYGCSYFRDTSQYRCFNEEKYHYYYDEQSSCISVPFCAGDLYDCADKFRGSNYLETCPAEKNSTRRYKFFKEGNGKRYGLSGDCTTKWTYDYRFWDDHFRECDICLCTCDDSNAPYADSKINLRLVVADKDHVITSVKWVKINHTLHLQIEQGKVGVKGSIDENTLQWKDILPPRNEKEIATMSWKGLRGFLLQDIEVSEDNVIVGIKLDVVQNDNIKLVTFRLLPLPYEWMTGKLYYPRLGTPYYEDPDSSLSVYHMWDKPVKLPRHFEKDDEVDLGKAKVPSDSTRPSVPVARSKKYVRLTVSNFETDIGQNTVPYFDMQENIVSPAYPLAGVGIYLKKTEDFAGFLGIKLLTFDNTFYVAEEI